MQCAVLVTCQITLFLSPVAIPQLHPLPAFGSISTHFVTPPILVTGTPVFSPFSLPPATSPGRWKNSLSTDLRLQMQVLGHEHPQYLVEVPDPPEVQRGRIVPHLVPGLCHHVFFQSPKSLINLPWGKEQRWDEGLAPLSSWKECGHPQCQRGSLQHPAVQKNVDDRKKMIDPTWAPRYISGWLIRNWSETPWRLFCQTHFLWSASNSSQLPPADRTSHLFSRFLTTCSSRFWSFLTSWGFQLHERHVASTNQVEEDKYINSVKRNVLCLWYLSYISLPKCQWLVLQIKSIQIQCWYKGMLTCPEDFPQLLCAEKPDQENDLILGQPRCNRIYLVFPVLRQSSWAIDGVCAGPSVTIF